MTQPKTNPVPISPDPIVLPADKDKLARWQDRMEAAFEAFYTITPSEEQGFVGQAADQVAYIRTLFRDMPVMSDTEGTVPAGPGDALAQWRGRLLAMLVNHFDAGSATLVALRAHLAAMPQPDPNAELLAALRSIRFDCQVAYKDGVNAGVIDVIFETASTAIDQAERGAAG